MSLPRHQGVAFVSLLSTRKFGHIILSSFPGRGSSAPASLSNWSFAEIIASVLFAFRSTPHPVTGETPHKVLTGMDMVLSHFQEWTKYTTNVADVGARLKGIVFFRKEPLDHTVQEQTRALSKATSLSELQVGDLVVVMLLAKEFREIQGCFGTHGANLVGSKPSIRAECLLSCN